jgi:hypothetical protein
MWENENTNSCFGSFVDRDFDNVCQRGDREGCKAVD